MRVLWPRNTPMEMTLFSSTTTPSTTSERAPMKQLSSMITGFAWIGSSTPPMPTPPARGTFLPLWAHEPAVAPRPCDARGPPAAPPRREVEVLKLGRHLVEIPGRASLHPAVVLEPKRKQHGLLDPLVRDPFAARLLGHAQPPGVEPGDHLLDRLAQRARRVSGVEGGSFLPGLLDDVLPSCLANRLLRLTASTPSSVGA